MSLHINIIKSTSCHLDSREIRARFAQVVESGMFRAGLWRCSAISLISILLDIVSCLIQHHDFCQIETAPSPSREHCPLKFGRKISPRSRDFAYGDLRVLALCHHHAVQSESMQDPLVRMAAST